MGIEFSFSPDGLPQQLFHNQFWSASRNTVIYGIPVYYQFQVRIKTFSFNPIYSDIRFGILKYQFGKVGNENSKALSFPDRYSRIPAIILAEAPGSVIDSSSSASTSFPDASERTENCLRVVSKAPASSVPFDLPK